jgi:hypothetical protein
MLGISKQELLAQVPDFIKLFAIKNFKILGDYLERMLAENQEEAKSNNGCVHEGSRLSFS